jgi:molybdate transport system regulatory protein
MRCRATVKLMNSGDRDALGFGRGIVTLLEGIEKYGSINQATKAMDMAYSKAWKIINKTEEEFGVELISREGPHGSQLTEEARKLLTLYHKMEEAARTAADQVLRKYDS